MPLSPGTRLGHYDVTAKIGEGGMGEVWQATDTQLNRQVALKILPDTFAGDPDRLSRFTREAQILASLNHPGIAAIYGIEEDEAEGRRALVLELVEGPTLADRISKGPIPLDEALPIAKQIAEALEAAHEAGVIHRDLKPANIKVKDDGTVKILDFGLAKALDSAPEGDASQSPTLTVAATQMGVIMGTAAYMSPEQARGKPVDKRADIWAFGCVLYEMLTGGKAFDGDDVSLTLSLVLQSQPATAALPASVPGAILRLVSRCLEKDRRRRLRDIGDAIAELDEATASTGPTDAGGQPVHGAPVRRAALPWAAGLLVLAVLVAAWTALRPTPPVEVTRFSITVPPGAAVGSVALSPDGRQVAYVVADADGERLYRRSMDALEPEVLRGAAGRPLFPFFSPDGEWVGFFERDGGTLRKVPASGGPSVRVTDAPAPDGAAVWTSDDTIVYATIAVGLRRVSALGGDPEAMTSRGSDLSHTMGDVLPGGDVLFTARQTAGARVAVASRDGGVYRTLVDGTSPRYVDTGHLVLVCPAMVHWST